MKSDPLLAAIFCHWLIRLLCMDRPVGNVKTWTWYQNLSIKLFNPHSWFMLKSACAVIGICGLCGSAQVNMGEITNVPCSLGCGLMACIVKFQILEKLISRGCQSTAPSELWCPWSQVSAALILLQGNELEQTEMSSWLPLSPSFHLSHI